MYMLLPIAVLLISFLTSTPHDVDAAVFRTGSGYLQVADWSLVKNALKTGDYIRSEPFNVSGHEWVIDFYPRGYNDHFPNATSVLVNLFNGKGRVKALYAHSLFDWKTGNWSHPRSLEYEMETFSPNMRTFAGYFYFVSHSELEASNYLGKGNDTLLIRTNLWVLQGNTSTSSTTDAPFHNDHLPYARPFDSSLIKLHTDA